MDDRFFVVNGRRWRRTDPSIPEPLRAELVKELMAARRIQDRPRTQDAKVALGERGRPWWEPRDEAADRERLGAAVHTLLRSRGEGKTICPSDAARAVGGGDWRMLLPLARDVARSLAARLPRLRVHVALSAVLAPLALPLWSPEGQPERAGSGVQGQHVADGRAVHEVVAEVRVDGRAHRRVPGDVDEHRRTRRQ